LFFKNSAQHVIKANKTVKKIEQCEQQYGGSQAKKPKYLWHSFTASLLYAKFS